MTEELTGDEKNEIAKLAGVPPKDVHLYLLGKKMSLKSVKAIDAVLATYQDGKFKK